MKKEHYGEYHVSPNSLSPGGYVFMPTYETALKQSAAESLYHLLSLEEHREAVSRWREMWSDTLDPEVLDIVEEHTREVWEKDERLVGLGIDHSDLGSFFPPPPIEE